MVDFSVPKFDSHQREHMINFKDIQHIMTASHKLPISMQKFRVDAHDEYSLHCCKAEIAGQLEAARQYAALTNSSACLIIECGRSSDLSLNKAKQILDAARQSYSTCQDYKDNLQVWEKHYSQTSVVTIVDPPGSQHERDRA